MYIAIIVSGHAVESGGGVRMQGLMWRDGLQALGHTVMLINFWEENDWTLFDAIIVLQMTGDFDAILSLLSKYNERIFFAPILDPGPRSTIKRYKFLAKTLSYFCRSKFGMFSHLSSPFTKFYTTKNSVKCFLTRSIQESSYVSNSFDIPPEKIKLVPLSLRFDALDSMPSEKENFCLHVSRLASPNKNVLNLILAAQKYGFELKLAGCLHGADEYVWLKSVIGSYNNIEYLGELDDDELKSYYRRAKVFALPSISEGVGMVAMEAAAYGCEIVLTNVGAPKDYYNDMAYLVDPFSIDSIGQGVVHCLDQGFSQPTLMKYIKCEYSLISCSKKLEQAIMPSKNKK